METAYPLQVRRERRNFSDCAGSRRGRIVRLVGKRVHRVLVVDPYRDAGESLGTLLELWGYKATVVGNAVDALVAAQTRRPDAVILEMVLPRIDGYELARQLRRLDGFDDVTLMAITGYVRPGDEERARAAGLDHFLLKPADPDLLHRVLSLRRAVLTQETRQLMAATRAASSVFCGW